MGQHEPGKHSKAGKKRAAEQPRVPKGRKKGTTAGGIYDSGNAKNTGGLIAKFFKKKGL